MTTRAPQLSRTSPDPALVVTDLEKRFGRVAVLQGATLSLTPGRVTALVGPNASGKSTLIKCVLGLVRPDAGSIRLLGAPVGRDPQYRRFVGYMPQLPSFPDQLTGAEVLALLAALRPGAAPEDEALRRTLGLTADALSQPIRTLSGGTRQKLNALVALRQRPPVLILDEPTAALDPVASTAIKAEVRDRAAHGTAVLLTGHVLSEIEELADDLVYLTEGRVRFRGSLGELRSLTGEDRMEQAIARLVQEAA